MHGRWGERHRDSGRKAWGRGLTRTRQVVRAPSKGDKNSSSGPRAGSYRRVSVSWQGLGRKQTGWGESSSVNMWMEAGACLGRNGILTQGSVTYFGSCLLMEMRSGWTLEEVSGMRTARWRSFDVLQDGAGKSSNRDSLNTP